MSEDEKVDLSALDPFPDPVRFERTVKAIAARALSVRQRRQTVSGQLSAWARPALAVAAGVALVSWVPSLWLRARGQGQAAAAPSQTVAGPAPTLMEWAARDALPEDTTELLRTLGGVHGGSAP